MKLSFINESNLRWNLLFLTIDVFYFETLAREELLPYSSLFILFIYPFIYLRIFYIQGWAKIVVIDGRSSGSNCKIYTIKFFNSLQKLLPSS